MGSPHQRLFFVAAPRVKSRSARGWGRSDVFAAQPPDECFQPAFDAWSPTAILQRVLRKGKEEISCVYVTRRLTKNVVSISRKELKLTSKLLSYTAFRLCQHDAHFKSLAMFGHFLFPICLGLSLVFVTGACGPASTREAPVVERMPSGKHANADDVNIGYAVTTEFALRKCKMGMTRQSIEREIGLGERWLAGEHDVFSYPMLYNASLLIQYESGRAAVINIISREEGRADWELRPSRQVSDPAPAVPDAKCG